MSNITLKLSKDVIMKMQSYYQTNLELNVPYAYFRARVSGATITAYTSGKVLFQGNHAQEEAAKWQTGLPEERDETKAKAKVSSSVLPTGFKNWSVIGSDEVGNGSYFGPLTVCAAYVAKDKFDLLKELGVKDSKLLSDKQIQELAWQIKASIPYHLIVCSPNRYNQLNEFQNANRIKVNLHNEAIQALVSELSDEESNECQGILIDQFTTEKNFYRHLEVMENPYQGKLYFAKQAESIHLSVAAASIIARDAFLRQLDILGAPYNLALPSGAGANVDKVAASLIRQYGIQALEQTAKVHFANTEKAQKIAQGKR